MDKKYIILTNSKSDEFSLRDEERNLDYAYFYGGHGLWSSNLKLSDSEEKIKEQCNKIRQEIKKLEDLING